MAKYVIISCYKFILNKAPEVKKNDNDYVYMEYCSTN